MIPRLSRVGMAFAAIAGLLATAMGPEDRSIEAVEPPALQAAGPVPSPPAFDVDSAFSAAGARRLFFRVESAAVVDGAAPLTPDSFGFLLVGVITGRRPFALLKGRRPPERTVLVGPGDSVGSGVVRAIDARSVDVAVGDILLTLVIADESNE